MSILRHGRLRSDFRRHQRPPLCVVLNLTRVGLSPGLLVKIRTETGPRTEGQGPLQHRRVSEVPGRLCFPSAERVKRFFKNVNDDIEKWGSMDAVGTLWKAVLAWAPRSCLP